MGTKLIPRAAKANKLDQKVRETKLEFSFTLFVSFLTSTFLAEQTEDKQVQTEILFAGKIRLFT